MAILETVVRHSLMTDYYQRCIQIEELGCIITGCTCILACDIGTSNTVGRRNSRRISSRTDNSKSDKEKIYSLDLNRLNQPKVDKRTSSTVCRRARGRYVVVSEGRDGRRAIRGNGTIRYKINIQVSLRWSVFLDTHWASTRGRRANGANG